MAVAASSLHLRRRVDRCGGAGGLLHQQEAVPGSADFGGGLSYGLVEILRADVEFLGDVFPGLQLGLLNGVCQVAAPR